MFSPRSAKKKGGQIGRTHATLSFRVTIMASRERRRQGRSRAARRRGQRLYRRTSLRGLQRSAWSRPEYRSAQVRNRSRPGIAELRSRRPPPNGFGLAFKPDFTPDPDLVWRADLEKDVHGIEVGDVRLHQRAKTGVVDLLIEQQVEGAGIGRGTTGSDTVKPRLADREGQGALRVVRRRQADLVTKLHRRVARLYARIPSGHSGMTSRSGRDELHVEPLAGGPDCGRRNRAAFCNEGPASAPRAPNHLRTDRPLAYQHMRVGLTTGISAKRSGSGLSRSIFTGSFARAISVKF